MARCNNKCVFCMVSNEIASSTDIPLEIIKQDLSQLPRGAIVDLFGGEPTLYPDFFSLLAHLQDLGLLFQIASNGRIFSDRDFAHQVAEYKPILVRTSIYGDNAHTHDYLTRSPGSFTETMLGIQNMVDLDIPVSVNYVILNTNCDQIWKSSMNLMGFGVRSFKYSLPIRTKRFRHLLADLTSIRYCLSPTLACLESNRLDFIIEKAPFCLAPRYLRHYFMENSDEMLQNLSLIFEKTAVCSNCVLNTYCHGVERGYYKIYSEAGLKPLTIEDLPSNFIKSITFEQLIDVDIGSGFSLFRLTDEDSLLTPGNLARFFSFYAEKRKAGCLIGLI